LKLCNWSDYGDRIIAIVGRLGGATALQWFTEAVDRIAEIVAGKKINKFG